MTTDCEGCGSSDVRKVSAVVNAGTSSGLVEGTGGSVSYESSTNLASQIGLPWALSYLDLAKELFAAAFRSAIITGLLNLFLGMPTWGIVGRFVGARAWQDLLFYGVIAIEYCVVLAICIRYSNARLFAARRRAQARRLKTYDQEWYCFTCDSIFIPNQANSTRPSSQANDFS